MKLLSFLFSLVYSINCFSGSISNTYLTDLNSLGFEHIEQGLFAQSTEVSNADYLEFLEDMSRQNVDIDSLLPDTLVWRENLAFNEPYIEYYLRHPAYRDYPVVGVSYDQAMAYCNWFTDKVNEKFGEQGRLRVKLPTEEQWIKAARAGSNPADLYPWGNEVTISRQEAQERGFYKRHYGLYNIDKWFKPLRGQYTFLNVKGAYFGLPNNNQTSVNVTSHSRSYLPTSNGLYNICGNVSEMLLEKGFAKGGSWKDGAEAAQINAPSSKYDAPSSDLGFRVFIEVLH